MFFFLFFDLLGTHQWWSEGGNNGAHWREEEGRGESKKGSHGAADEVLAYQTTREHELKEAIERLTGSGVNKRA